MATTASFDIGTFVTSSPEIYGGRPCLAGTRFPILELAVRYNAGMSPEEIVTEIDGLELALVYAGVAFYLANKAEIDRELEVEREEYEAGVATHTTQHPSVRR